MAEPKIVERTIYDYIPDDQNANAGTEFGLQMVEQSLREDGVGRSIVADKNGKIPAGNKTLEAAVNAGITKVYEVETDGDAVIVHKRRDWNLDDPKGPARRYAYRDNRSSEISLQWNPEQLLADMNAGVDLEALFGKQDLAELLAGLQDEPTPDPGAQIDKAEELQQKWQVQRGDLWQVGEHKILCGDSTNAEDVARVLAGEKADAVVTDPPYGIDIVGKNGHLGGGKIAGVNKYVPIVGDDKPFDPGFLLDAAPVLVLFGANYYADKLPSSSGWIVWDKREDTTSDNHADCEMAWTNIKRPARIYSQLWRGMIRRGESGDKMHPTQKPVGLFIWIFETCTQANELIYDPFLGSGSTIIAAENTSRRCYGLEIEPRYCAVILERVSGLGLTPLRVEKPAG